MVDVGRRIAGGDSGDVNAYLSSEIGTGMTVMLILLGQVGGGLVVDRFGLLGVPRKHVRATQYVGVILAAMGIVLKAL